MEHFVRIIMEQQLNLKLDESVFPKQNIYETEQQVSIIEMPLPRQLSESESDEFAEKLANFLFEHGYNDFDIEINTGNVQQLEETYNGEDFFEAYGVMWFNEDQLDEAEYQGRKVALGKPVRSSGGPKKFHVFVKNPKGNVVKVNFGDPNMKIKKSNPARRKSFRARHNCANPGPRHRARYWSCRAW
jgi:GrpB-like predicted nucleotidyltransferase (UPF0157 family)